MRFRLLALCSVLALSAACGITDTAPVTIETTTFADTTIKLSKFTKLPSGMYVRDSIVGTGKVPASGDSVFVHYVGSLPNGQVFDSNQTPTTPFAFILGSGSVIPGFDIGVQGMHVGGKRQLIIPPELGYGAYSVGPIPAYSVLVFTVDVVSSKP